MLYNLSYRSAANRNPMKYKKLNRSRDGKILDIQNGIFSNFFDNRVKFQDSSVEAVNRTYDTLRPKNKFFSINSNSFHAYSINIQVYYLIAIP